MVIFSIFFIKNGTFRKFLKSRFDPNMHQKRIKLHHLKKKLGGACSQTSLAKHANFQISKTIISLGPPLPNPGYAPVYSIVILRRTLYNIKFTSTWIWDLNIWFWSIVHGLHSLCHLLITQEVFLHLMVAPMTRTLCTTYFSFYPKAKAQGRQTHSFLQNYLQLGASTSWAYLKKAYEGTTTRKKINHKSRHIALNSIGSHFWNQLSFADSPTLENFRYNFCRQINLSVILHWEPC